MEERPLDEYEVFETKSANADAPDQPFTITKNQRYLMLGSISYCILYLIRYVVSSTFTGLMDWDLSLKLLVNALNIAASSYFYYFMIGYYRFYGLNSLKVIMILTLITQLSIHLTGILPMLDIVYSTKITAVIDGCAIIIELIWIIIVLITNGEYYSAFRSIKKAALSSIFVLIISFITPLLIISVLPYNYYGFISLTYLPVIIPFIFMIDFVLKLKVKTPY